jgi:hypothetical protein
LGACGRPEGIEKSVVRHSSVAEALGEGDATKFVHSSGLLILWSCFGDPGSGFVAPVDQTVSA